jgi:hypothetical protein
MCWSHGFDHRSHRVTNDERLEVCSHLSRDSRVSTEQGASIQLQVPLVGD